MSVETSASNLRGKNFSSGEIQGISIEVYSRESSGNRSSVTNLQTHGDKGNQASPRKLFLKLGRFLKKMENGAGWSLRHNSRESLWLPKSATPVAAGEVAKKRAAGNY